MALTLFFQLFLFLNFTSAFVHPGLLVSDTDITRIKAKLALKLDPWQSSWDKLTSIPYAQSTYKNNAVSRVYRGTATVETENAERLWHDAAAAFNLGLRWKIEGDAQYAKAAAAILNAWGEKLEILDKDDDQYLTAGFQGYELANAAELIRDFTPFAKDGLTKFNAMFERLILSKNIFFLEHRAGSEHNVKHFFANWELGNMASVMAFGVLTDNSTLFDFAVDYFKTGSGNGGINNCISNLVKEPGTGNLLGQPQESGRDQGHTGLDFQMLGVIAQQAWNQGEDLYGFNDSKILKGAEYYARYNLGNDVPFEPYTNGIVSYDKISAASRGAHRPTWELLYAHYAQIKGVDAPWTEEYKNYTVKAMGGFEGGAGSWGEGSGHYDGLGWGSLLYHLDEDDVAVASNVSTSNSTSPTTNSSTTAFLPSSTSASTSTSVPTSTSAPTSTTVAVTSSSSTISKQPVATSNSTSVYPATQTSGFNSFTISTTAVNLASSPRPNYPTITTSQSFASFIAIASPAPTGYNDEEGEGEEEGDDECSE
ncbi:hypothetical protein EYC80_006869 [Monilinia laxa]|uniref:Alginate lyase domain-containing protein n=1 Tax=Monilinia laxa TaxID=61186 RepID=A0A5N6JZE9_MONLA|nr:hypothetical protein EYC80_006869 [Monilinia laxa]